MAHFKKGSKVVMSKKTVVIIDKFIGNGSQADVYKAHIVGTNTPVAFKHFYHDGYASNKDGFYRKVRELTEKVSPHPDLCWPIAITNQAKDKSFAYIMPFANGYNSLADIINNVEKLIPEHKAVLLVKIARVLDTLHSSGLIFGDISHLNILYKIENGNILIKLIDCENISEKGEFYGLRGSERYQPPEFLVKNFNNELYPNTKHSDCFAFHVLAFRVLLRRHPLDGKRTRSVRIDDPQAYTEFFGIRPRFIFDGNENEVDDNPMIIKRWNELPEPLKEYFRTAFSQKSLVYQTETRPDTKSFIRAALMSYYR